MTNQEVFDTVVQHLAQQKQPAVEGNRSSCYYRTSTGLKCPVGCLIPDEEYQEAFETLEFMTHEVISACPSLKTLSETLLIQLQNAHDERAHNAASLQAELRNIARDFFLDAASVKRITEWTTNQ